MILPQIYFKALCTEQTEREDKLASDFSCSVCLVSGDTAFLFTAIGFSAHSQEWWCEMKEKICSLHSGEEFLLQLIVAAD